jgi:hypothetical protein
MWGTDDIDVRWDESGEGEKGGTERQTDRQFFSMAVTGYTSVEASISNGVNTSTTTTRSTLPLSSSHSSELKKGKSSLQL